MAKAAARGPSFKAPDQTQLAGEIIGRVAPVERIWLVNSGTEATASCRAAGPRFTGRAKIVKFSGCYHGHVDARRRGFGSTLGLCETPQRLVSPRSQSSQKARSGRGSRHDVLPYNDIDAASRPFAREQIAAVITEASPGNRESRPARAPLQRGAAARSPPSTPRSSSTR